LLYGGARKNSIVTRGAQRGTRRATLPPRHVHRIERRVEITSDAALRRAACATLPPRRCVTKADPDAGRSCWNDVDCGQELLLPRSVVKIMAPLPRLDVPYATFLRV